MLKWLVNWATRKKLDKARVQPRRPLDWPAPPPPNVRIQPTARLSRTPPQQIDRYPDYLTSAVIYGLDRSSESSSCDTSSSSDSSSCSCD